MSVRIGILHHFPNRFLIIVSLMIIFRIRRLEQSVIPLRIEKTRFIKTSQLELMVDVSGNDKIILIVH